MFLSWVAISTRLSRAWQSGDQGLAALDFIRSLEAQAHRIREQVVVVIGEGAPVEGGDRLIKGLGNGGDGGGTDSVVEELREDWADLAGGEAAEEHADLGGEA